MSALKFEDLRGASNNVTSLAYWVALTRVWRIDDEERSRLVNAMSYQYDVEEQSECSGWAELLVDESRWHRRLRPIAPVQLTNAWSSCPLASELMGDPFSMSVATRSYLGREVAMIWHRRQIDRVQRFASEATGGWGLFTRRNGNATHQRIDDGNRIRPIAPAERVKRSAGAMGRSESSEFRNSSNDL